MKRKLFILSFIFLCGCLLSAQTVSETEVSLYNEVISSFSSGFYPGTVEKATLLEKSYPQSSYLLQARIKKGQALLYMKDYSASQNVLNQALLQLHSGNKDFSLCNYLIAQNYYYQKKYPQALNYFYIACKFEKDTKNSEIYSESILFSAKSYYSLKDYQNSALLFEQIIADGSAYSIEEYKDSLIKLIISYDNTKNYNKAINLYKSLPLEFLEKLDDTYLCNLLLVIAQNYEDSKDFKNAYDVYSQVTQKGVQPQCIISLKKAYMLASENKISENPADIFEKTQSLFENQKELVCEFWVRLAIDEYDSKNFQKSLEYFSKSEESIQSGVDFDTAIIQIYKAKINIDTNQNLLETENNLEKNKNQFISSNINNIQDSYYSTLLQLKNLNGKTTEVPLIYKKITNPGSLDDYINASFYYAKNDYDGVIQNLSKLDNLDVNNENYNNFSLYASSLIQTKKYAKADTVYSKMEQNAEVTSLDYLEWAKALFYLKKYDLACQKASMSNQAESEYVCGLCKINLQDFEKAKSYFITYIKNNSNKDLFIPLSIYYKGLAEYNLEDFKNSYASFVRFVKESQGSAKKYVRNAYEYAARCALQNKDLKNAAIQAENSLKYSYTAEQKQNALIFCTDIYCDAKEYEKALTLLSPYLTEKNDFAIRAMFETARIHERKENLTQAELYYNKIYNEHPKSEYAETSMYRIAEMYYAKEDFATAENRFNKYIYAYTDGKYTDSAIFYCADCNFKLSQYEKAIMLNRTLLAKYPDGIYVYGANKNLLNSYIQINENTNALEVAKTLLNQFPEQAAKDGIGRTVIELEQIVSGTDKEIVKKLSEYENNGKTSTIKGRNAGSQLVMLYAQDETTKEKAYNLATELLKKQTDQELFYKAQNAQYIATYLRAKYKNTDSALMYLKACEYYRGCSETESINAAACLYNATEAFIADNKYADARESSMLLKELYPNSRYAKKIDSLF